MQSFLNVIPLQTYTFFTTLTPRLHGRSKRFFRRPQNLNAPRIINSHVNFIAIKGLISHTHTLWPCDLYGCLLVIYSTLYSKEYFALNNSSAASASISRTLHQMRQLINLHTFTRLQLNVVTKIHTIRSLTQKHIQVQYTHMQQGPKFSGLTNFLRRQK